MKKVINITLGGLVFAVEQDAYDALEQYLSQIKQRMIGNDDATEIVADVETAIAEKFTTRGRSEKLAVTTTDVTGVIAELGSPQEFGDGEELGDGSTDATVMVAADTTESAAADKTDKPKRRFYRDTEDSIVAGVASGIANYFAIDPVLTRLAFVILLFFNGFGFFAYIILWLIVPEAKTSAEKFAMHGELGTLKDISDRVKKNLENLDTEALASSSTKARGLLDSLFRLLGGAVRLLGKIIRYGAATLLFIGGLVGLVLLVVVYSLLWLSDKTHLPLEIQAGWESLQSGAAGMVLFGSLFVLIVVPLLAAIMAGVSLFRCRNVFTVTKTTTLVVAGMIALTVTAVTLSLQAEKILPHLGPIERSLEERFEDHRFEDRFEYDFERTFEDGFDNGR